MRKKFMIMYQFVDFVMVHRNLKLWNYHLSYKKINKKYKKRKKCKIKMYKCVKWWTSNSSGVGYLVSNDEVWVNGGPGPAHDGDEHGKGGENQIHVQDEGHLQS